MSTLTSRGKGATSRGFFGDSQFLFFTMKMRVLSPWISVAACLLLGFSWDFYHFVTRPVSALNLLVFITAWCSAVIAVGLMFRAWTMNHRIKSNQRLQTAQQKLNSKLDSTLLQLSEYSMPEVGDADMNHFFAGMLEIQDSARANIHEIEQLLKDSVGTRPLSPHELSDKASTVRQALRN